MISESPIPRSLSSILALPLSISYLPLPPSDLTHLHPFLSRPPSSAPLSSPSSTFTSPFLWSPPSPFPLPHPPTPPQTPLTEPKYQAIHHQILRTHPRLWHSTQRHNPATLAPTASSGSSSSSGFG